MAPDRFIGKKRIKGRESFCEGHLVIQQMQPSMALAADCNTAVEFFAIVMLPEMLPAVQLSRDQVVKCQPRYSAA